MNVKLPEDCPHCLKIQRDEAREAARFMVLQMGDMELTPTEKEQWPWLEETE